MQGLRWVPAHMQRQDSCAKERSWSAEVATTLAARVDCWHFRCAGRLCFEAWQSELLTHHDEHDVCGIAQAGAVEVHNVGLE